MDLFTCAVCGRDDDTEYFEQEDGSSVCMNCAKLKRETCASCGGIGLFGDEIHACPKCDGGG